MPFKKKKLNKAEEFYVKNNPDSKSVEELAKELNTVIEVVQPFYTAPVKPPKQETLVNKLMGKKVRNNEVVATVLTEGAEQLSEDAKKARKGLPNDNKAFIHKPMG